MIDSGNPQINDQDFIFWLSKLQPHYQPAESVKQQLKTKNLILLSGPDRQTLMKLAEASKCHQIFSDKTKSSVDLHGRYKLKSDYLEIIKDLEAGKYLRFSVENQQFEGLHSEQFDGRHQFCWITKPQHLNHLQTLGFNAVVPIYLLPASYAKLVESIQQNNSNQHALQNFKTELDYIKDQNQHNVILNDDYQFVLNDFRSLLKSGQIDSRRQQLVEGTLDLLLRYLGD